MPKLATPLSDVKIKNLKPKDKDYIIGDGDNLFLKVYKSGKKVFLFNHKDIKTNKAKMYKIGEYPLISLSAARVKRVELASKVTNGNSLEYKSISLKSVVDSYFESKNDITPKHKKLMHSLLSRYVLSSLGSVSIDKISRKDIVNALSPFVASGKKESVRKALGELSLVYKYALLHEYVEHNIISDIDKKMLIGSMQVKHYAYIKSDEDLTRLLIAINESEGEIVRMCAKLMLYTAVRSENARTALWSEFDLSNNLWHIPSSKMKARKDFSVYISPSLKDSLLEYKQRLDNMGLNSKYLFPSPRSLIRPLSNNAVRVMLRSAGFSKDELTPHGFRASFSTIANEHKDIHKQSADVIELCLAHVDKDKVRDAYNHADNLANKTKLWQWWSDYLDGLSR